MDKFLWKSVQFGEDSVLPDSTEDSGNQKGLLLLKCPLVLDAFKKLTSDDITISSFNAIIIKIDKDLSPLSLEQHQNLVSNLASQENLQFTSFTSTISSLSWIYWKLPEWTKIFGLYEFCDVSEGQNDEKTPEKAFVHDFILSSILTGHSGKSSY